MATLNSLATSFVPPSLCSLISIKLTATNYLLQVSQITPMCCDQFGFVDETQPCPPKFIPDSQGKDSNTLNPEFVTWCKKDQFLLSGINATLSKCVLGTVCGLKIGQQTWNVLVARFASNSRSCVAHNKQELQTHKQGSKTCLEYVQSAKNLADQLSAVVKPVDDEDLISCIGSGLTPSYNSFVTSFSFATCESFLTFQKFQMNS